MNVDTVGEKVTYLDVSKRFVSGECTILCDILNDHSVTV